MTNHRNIYRVASGHYEVRVFRRGMPVYVATFRRIKDAITARDAYEAAHATAKPWGRTPRKVNARTCAVIRAERAKARLCIYCGEKARRGKKSCQGCADVAAAKRAA